MRKKWLPLMIATAVFVSSPLLAGDEDEKEHKEKKHCSYEVEDCVKAMEKEFSQRGWVGINMEPDEEAGGVVLTWIAPDSPAEAAGLKNGLYRIAMVDCDSAASNSTPRSDSSRSCSADTPVGCSRLRRRSPTPRLRSRRESRQSSCPGAPTSWPLSDAWPPRTLGSSRRAGTCTHG